MAVRTRPKNIEEMEKLFIMLIEEQNNNNNNNLTMTTMMMMMIMILMMIRKERISERYRAVGYFMHIDCVLQSVCVRARAVEVV